MVKAPISLYFHIPFCNKKCPYCHFYVIPNNEKHKAELLEGLLLEWETVASLVYKNMKWFRSTLVGALPLLFGVEPIERLINVIPFSDCEITIEANPEDVTPELMKGYRSAGINRVSIGVQSLQDDSLQVLERTHNAKRLLMPSETTYNAGLTNISIDLMYELPNQTPASFQKTLNRVRSIFPLPISHFTI